MSKPLITVGIACFNEGDWLLDCWKSVLSQTDNRWESVIVMDGTTHQRTRQIFNKLEHKKLRKYEMPINMGPFPTHNMAFRLTETPYHLILDADDQLPRESVTLILDTFFRYPDAGFVYGDYELFGSRNTIRKYPSVVTLEDFIEKQPIPGACAIKKAVWERLSGFAPELARGNGDYDFQIGAKEAGIKGLHCGRVFYRYRVGHSTKVSDSYIRRYHETHKIIVQRHRVFFKNRRHRNRFLAIGYEKAAFANFAYGDRKRASDLAWAAIYHGMWKKKKLLSLVLEGKLPAWGYRLFRYIWRLGRAFFYGSMRGR